MDDITFSKTIAIKPLTSGANVGKFSVVAFDDDSGEAIGGAYITPSYVQANTYAESIADFAEGDTIVLVEGDA